MKRIKDVIQAITITKYNIKTNRIHHLLKKRQKNMPQNKTAYEQRKFLKTWMIGQISENANPLTYSRTDFKYC